MGKTVWIGNPPVDVDMRASARARRISLRVSGIDGKVTLTRPRGVAEAEALAFLDQKAEWIAKQLSARPEPVIVGPGSDLPIEGQSYPIRTGAVRAPLLEDGQLIVPDRKGNTGRRLVAFCKERARQRLSAAVDRYAARLGQSPGGLRLRDTRSRWGSCASSGDLMFSWRLILAPPQALDYVAAHEVAHLREMHHGAAFWELLAQISPDYREGQTWLRRHGQGLHRYRFTD